MATNAQKKVILRLTLVSVPKLLAVFLGMEIHAMWKTTLKIILAEVTDVILVMTSMLAFDNEICEIG